VAIEVGKVFDRRNPSSITTIGIGVLSISFPDAVRDVPLGSVQKESHRVPGPETLYTINNSLRTIKRLGNLQKLFAPKRWFTAWKNQKADGFGSAELTTPSSSRLPSWLKNTSTRRAAGMTDRLVKPDILD
jgi:hypothetical protein